MRGGDLKDMAAGASSRLALPCLIFALLHQVRSIETELTDENWDELTENKVVFLKFHAPWCTQCRRVEQPWASVAESVNGGEKKDILIGSMDCSRGGKNKCFDLGVTSYPSFKYGHPDYLEDYTGPWEGSDLQQWAKDKLQRRCSPLS
ncbi:unnamed protein product, partial [Polarella glacialis]